MKRTLIISAACILMLMNVPSEIMAAEQMEQIVEENDTSEEEYLFEDETEEITGEVIEEITEEITEEVISGELAVQAMVEDSITDVNGETFKIARPNPDALNKVNAEQFGVSPDNYDNYTAFSNAINYCKEHPNTYLEINKGIYHFRTNSDISMNDLSNILIDGNGSEFIFSTPKYFKINRCNGIEIRELAIEWDWESSRLASLVKIYKCNKEAKTFEIEFMELDDVDVDIPIICFMQFDKEALIPGTYGGYKTFYPGQVPGGIVKREKVAPNRIKIYCGAEDYLKTFHDEEVYLIRHYTYGGRVFQPSKSENITFDDIHIYSAAGMGYIISDKTKYFQIINSSIGRRTDRADAPYISTTADGIHILNTSGYFRIENCDFSFTGDDIMNIHDDVMSFTKNENGTVFTGKVTGTFANPGDKVKFKNVQMGTFPGCEDYEVEVESFVRDSKTNDATITFKTPVDSAIGNEGFIYRSSTSTSNYVIRNNYIHETKGRGMLLLGSNMLVENNEFYRTVSSSLHVLADVDPDGLGSGGYGPSNVIIRNNTFTECSTTNAKPILMARYKNGDKISEYKDVLNNIKIENNKFIGCFNYAIAADNVTNLTIIDNEIRDCDNRSSDSVSSKNISIGEHCDNVINEGNNITTTSHVDTHNIIMLQGRAPSCVSYGMKPIPYCNDCHRKLTGVVAINPIAHTAGKEVVENKVDATCAKTGSYEKVTYCTECEKELTRETKEVAVTGKHNYSEIITKASTTANGRAETKCMVCGNVSNKSTIYYPKTYTLENTSYEYTGSQIKPAITVKDCKGNVVDAKYYTVSYGTNKAVGNGTVKVTFKGNYEGNKTVEFKITPKKTTIGTPAIASDGITVKWTKNESTKGYIIYRSVNGAAYEKVKTITDNTVISWKDTGANVNGSKYQYKIVSYKVVDGVNYKSGYSSVKTRYFVTQPAIESLINGSTGKMTLKWKQNSKATGYQIQYSTDSSFATYKTSNVTSNATVTRTFSNLTKGSKYYVRIRSYKTVGDTKYYSAWSSKKSVTIEK